MDTLDSLNAEISDWRTAYNQVKEQYEGLLEQYRNCQSKLRAEQAACAEAKNNDRIAMERDCNDY